MTAHQPAGDVFEMILHGDNPAKITKLTDGAAASWRAQEPEGQLAVDVYETERDVIVTTTMAGATTDKIDVHVHNNDLLTIRGERPRPVAEKVEPVHQECFWGKFSRTVVLPADVDGNRAHAEYRNGVLTISIPKQINSRIPIEIVEE